MRENTVHRNTETKCTMKKENEKQEEIIIGCRQYINPKSSDFAHLLLPLLHVSRDALAKTARLICQKFLNCLAKKMENRRQNANYKEQIEF
ncbi:hypothetical protein T02_14465 [Trichinella nativa]|uniref:Uncharacterized protein n=1 Tax=Trichinella nativa TaxID=6335 RepID=A0A0V1KXZ2_9BILA|nr:hypothetical protein T02_14465 [Trichinella nativa]